MASQPSNSSEWQLYRVLQRANLLQYYDTFVAQGGDDVPQLCEAGEEEFLEIMALVGMASKPLHVRRLQKALQEWVANPAVFQGTEASGMLVRVLPTQVSSLTGESSAVVATGNISNPACSWNISQPSVPVVVSMATPSPPAPVKSMSPVTVNMVPSVPASGSTPPDLKPDFFQGQMKKQVLSPQQAPALSDEQVSGIEDSAARIAKSLPAFEPKPLSQKKDINKQIYEIINLPIELTRDRLDMMRKYAAIYRRFDSDRSYSKPMSLHEICVNEAAAQLCYRVPNLLTRREDLFPLSRQVVKESGYQYSKGHSRSADLNLDNPSKRQKLDALYQENHSTSPLTPATCSPGDREGRQERLKQIAKDLQTVSEKQDEYVAEMEAAKEGHDLEKVNILQGQLELIISRQLQLLSEQSHLLGIQSNEVYIDIDNCSDREDSIAGASGPSTPERLEREAAQQQPHNTLKAMLQSGQIPVSSLNSLTRLTGFNFSQSGMNNSLFDEGLRIAQQYGLGEFAQELKSLQGESSDTETKGDNEETDNTCGIPKVVVPCRKVNGTSEVLTRSSTAATCDTNSSDSGATDSENAAVKHNEETTKLSSDSQCVKQTQENGHTKLKERSLSPALVVIDTDR